MKPAQFILKNAGMAATYWGLSHVSVLVFKGIGVLPMPIWPAAALAFVACFYRGAWFIPGIAIGTVLANHFSLGAPWNYAACIAVMNTLGPLAGAAMMRRRVPVPIALRRPADVAICLFAMLVLTPALTATGGIGFKWALGLIPADKITVQGM